VDRSANLTVPLNGRPACHYCEQCQRGCFTASYFNSPSVTLPDAARTGRFTLVSDAIETLQAEDGRNTIEELTSLGARLVTTEQALAALDRATINFA